MLRLYSTNARNFKVPENQDVACQVIAPAQLKPSGECTMSHITNKIINLFDYEYLENEIDKGFNPIIGDNEKFDLVSDDIQYLKKLAFLMEHIDVKDRTFLKCDELGGVPDPDNIINNYSSVIGDGIHLIDQMKLAVHHE